MYVIYRIGLNIGKVTRFWFFVISAFTKLPIIQMYAKQIVKKKKIVFEKKRNQANTNHRFTTTYYG